MSASERRQTRVWRRREVLAAGGVGVGLTLLGCKSRAPRASEPLRPPSAVPERDFLARCIKCQRRYMSRYLKIFLGDKFPFIQF